MAAADGTVATKIVRVGLTACVAVLAAQSAADLVAVLGFHSYNSLVDLDRSNAVPDLVSIAIILSAAVGSAMLATRRRAVRQTTGALAVMIALVAIEDVAHLSDDASTIHGRVVIATIVCAALLVIAVALRTSGTPRICMLLGIALLAIDVKIPFAYDQLMNVTGNPWVQRGDFLYELGVVLDEGIETTAWALLSVGLWVAALEARDETTGRVDAPAA